MSISCETNNIFFSILNKEFFERRLSTLINFLFNSLVTAHTHTRQRSSVLIVFNKHVELMLFVYLFVLEVENKYKRNKQEHTTKTNEISGCSSSFRHCILFVY